MKQALNEQIALLRKEKGMTQEELAAVLGVSGQAVSKWESGVCCPDIGLLPGVADVFGVTLDTLMGRRAPVEDKEDVEDLLYRRITELSRSEAYSLALRAVFGIHAGLFASDMKIPDPQDMVQHAMEGEWGMSSIAIPPITTRMYRDAVFFAANGSHGSTWMRSEEIQGLRQLLADLAEGENLTVLLALHRLTVGSDCGVSLAAVARESGLDEETVRCAFNGALRGRVTVGREGQETFWSIVGKDRDLVPILSLLQRF